MWLNQCLCHWTDAFSHIVCPAIIRRERYSEKCVDHNYYSLNHIYFTTTRHWLCIIDSIPLPRADLSFLRWHSEMWSHGCHYQITQKIKQVCFFGSNYFWFILYIHFLKNVAYRLDVVEMLLKDLHFSLKILKRWFAQVLHHMLKIKQYLPQGSMIHQCWM